MPHTKIVATLGPASTSEPVLDALVAEGVDVVRLNFSHGTHETHRTAFERVRAAAARHGCQVAVLQDLGGPKIRTGRLEGGVPVMLEAGQTLQLTTGDGLGNRDRLFTAFAGLAAGVRAGDRLLLDDGRVELRVEGSDGHEIRAQVVFGGPLGEHKGINAPGVALPTAALTEKDERDLRFGLALGVDLVALSFVQTPEDLLAARRLAAEVGRSDVPLLAKIERPQAVQHIEAILDACDGIMVARGDLGLELPLEDVPRAQRQVTEAARRRGLPVIVATEVLDSMRTSPRPTRAEVSDAAHAVEAGVDAIMLSGETAVGVDPARVVRTLNTIIRAAEASAASPVTRIFRTAEATAPEALCEAAVTLADRGHADAIVAVTRTGRTARILSALRPLAQIVAVTPGEEVARRLALHRGIRSVVVDLPPQHIPLVDLAERLRQSRLLTGGQTVVLVSVDPDVGRPDANFLKLLRLPEDRS